MVMIQLVLVFETNYLLAIVLLQSSIIWEQVNLNYESIALMDARDISDYAFIDLFVSSHEPLVLFLPAVF